MALKDHSLDDKIIKAAFDEFMEFGFQKASIRKIADRAGVTPGAVYTRYDSKDDLFCSLVSNFLSAVKTQSEPSGKMLMRFLRIALICSPLLSVTGRNTSMKRATSRLNM